MDLNLPRSLRRRTLMRRTDLRVASRQIQLSPDTNDSGTTRIGWQYGNVMRGL